MQSNFGLSASPITELLTNSESHMQPHEPPKRSRSSEATPFLRTLWKLVDDDSTDSVISWDKRNIHGFKIHNLEKLKETTLRKFYTAKWESFRRQLYFYGFKGKNDTAWTHKDLDHMNPDSIKNIKRISKPKNNLKRNLEEMMQLYSMMQMPGMMPHTYPSLMPSQSPMLPPLINTSPPNYVSPEGEQRRLSPLPFINMPFTPTMSTSPSAKRMKLEDNPFFELLKSSSAPNESVEDNMQRLRSMKP